MNSVTQAINKAGGIHLVTSRFYPQTEDEKRYENHWNKVWHGSFEKDVETAIAKADEDFNSMSKGTPPGVVYKSYKHKPSHDTITEMIDGEHHIFAMKGFKFTLIGEPSFEEFKWQLRTRYMTPLDLMYMWRHRRIVSIEDVKKTIKEAQKCTKSKSEALIVSEKPITA